MDGKIVRQMGVKVDPATAVIRVDGTRIVMDDSLVHLALNKQIGRAHV